MSCLWTPRSSIEPGTFVFEVECGNADSSREDGFFYFYSFYVKIKSMKINRILHLIADSLSAILWYFLIQVYVLFIKKVYEICFRFFAHFSKAQVELMSVVRRPSTVVCRVSCVVCRALSGLYIKYIICTWNSHH